MFRFIASFFLIFSLSLFASDKDISVKSNLSTFVEWASTHLKKNIIIGADLSDSPLSIYATYKDQNQLETLLQHVVVSSGFYYSVSGNSIRIGSAPALDVSNLKTEVVQLEHVQSDFAAKSVAYVLNSRSDSERLIQNQVTASPTLNSLIITATLDEIDIIKGIISAIDAPRQQILITAIIAELTDSDYQSLGVRLSSGNKKSGLQFNFTGSPIKPNIGFSASLYNSGDLLSLLDLVNNSDKSKLLSTPSILTLNRQPASLLVGQEIPVITGKQSSESNSTDKPFQTIKRIEVGLGLDVTPTITPSGNIELKVFQTASSVSKDTTASDLVTNTRRISTTVTLHRGQSVLLGGLRTKNSISSKTRIPFFSSLPYIGRAFRSESDKLDYSNLVVFITADIYQNQKKIPDYDSIFIDLGLNDE